MGIIQEYIDYLKDNPNQFWFKRKLYGWGWTPATWQGWLLIVLFVVYLAWNSFMLPENPNLGQLNWFFIKTAASIFLLVFICYKKGEKPRWQWGKDNGSR